MNFKTELFPHLMMKIMEPISLLITLLDTVSWIAGGAFIFGAIERYMQYRRNPSQSPLNQVFFLAGIGITLILLPVVGHYALPNRDIVYW